MNLDKTVHIVHSGMGFVAAYETIKQYTIKFIMVKKRIFNIERLSIVGVSFQFIERTPWYISEVFAMFIFIFYS